MKNLARIVLLALAFVAAPAFASTTYTLIANKSVKAVCTTGSESAPSLSTEGMTLVGVASVAIQVCADSGQTITGGSGVVLYVYDALSGLWGRFNAAAYSVSTGARCAWVQGDSPGHGIPILAARGRLAAVPSGITVSSGSVTVYHFAIGQDGAGK